MLEGIDRCDVENEMHEDVTLKLAGEEQRQRTRIATTDRAGIHCATEVVREDAQAAPRRRFIRARVERHDDGRLL